MNRLSRFVRLPERSTDAQWDAIAHKRRRALHIPWRSAVGFSALAAACAIVWLVLPSKEASIFEGALFQTSDAAQQVTLADGSQLQLAAHTTVRVCGAKASLMCLSLEQGRARFVVERNPKRAFIVRAEDFEVRVIGTIFTVDIEQGARVSVERGIVQVTAESVHRLVAGESWSRVPAAANDQEAPTAQKQAPTPAPARPKKTEPKMEPVPAAVPIEEIEAMRERDAWNALWEAARAARKEGRSKDVERFYSQLLHDFPAHKGAALVAFELGRVRMEELQDLAGAITALERVLVLGGPQREDAIARLVRATSALGEREKCGTYATLYAREYPQGVHAPSLAGSCKAP